MYQTRFFKRVVFVCLLAIFVVNFPADVWSQEEEKRQLPSIAITQPTISENIESDLREDIDLVILLSRLESALQKTRKFRVLTRDKEDMEKIRTEQKYSQSELTDANAALPGNLQNANFIVNVNVEDFSFERQERPMPNLDGKFLRKDIGRIDLNVEILDTEKGELKSSFILNDTFETDDKVVNERSNQPPSTQFTNMAESTAKQFANKLLATVFPMTVTNVVAGKIFINRGQDGGLSEGEKLNVYQTGKKIRDPATGKVLGTTEVKIGVAEVIRVNPKFTKAELVDKTSNQPVKPGYVLRKQK